MLRRAGCWVLVGGMLSVSAGPPTRELRVVGQDERVVWRGRVHRGEQFDVSFTHSQERCRWTQHYVAGQAGVEQESSTFASFGAGMPAEDTGGARHSAGGYTVPAPAAIGELPMMHSDAADIVLRYRGRDVRLGPLLDDFELFSIRITPAR